MTLKSKRESGGFYYTPLKKVKGNFDHYQEEERKGAYAKPGQLDVTMFLTGIEVLETDAPYHYKTAEIKQKFSDSLSSAYVLFEDSIDVALRKESGASSIDNIVGMDIVMEREDDHVFFTDKATGKENKGVVWRVMSVDGVSSSASPLDTALTLLNGLTAGEFKSEAIKNPAVKRDSDLINSIISDQFLTSEGVSTLFNVVDGRFIRK